MLRIVQICTTKLPCPPLKGGAIERYVYGISKELAMDKAEVHIISLPGWDRSPQFQNVGNLIYHPVDFGLYNFMAFHSLLEMFLFEKFARKIVDVLDNIRRNYGEIDVISSHVAQTSLAPPIFKRRNPNVAIVHHFHNTFKGKRITNFIFRNYLRGVLSKYDCCIGVSNFVRKWLIEDLSIPHQRTVVVYNAIDEKLFKPFKEEERMKLKKMFALEDFFAILFVGRITPDKGLDHLIKALALLKKQGFDKFKLLIIGPKGDFYKKIIVFGGI